MNLIFIFLMCFATVINAQTGKDKNFDYVVACGVYIHNYIMPYNPNKPILQNPSLCSHIIINIDYGAIAIINETRTSDEMDNIMATKKNHPHLKILFSIFINPAILNDVTWERALEESEYFVNKYKLDGLNVQRYVVDEISLSKIKLLKQRNNWMITGMILPHLNLNPASIFDVFDMVFVADVGFYQNYRVEIGYMEANAYPDIDFFIDELDEKHKRKLIIPIPIRWFEYEIAEFEIVYQYFHCRCHVVNPEKDGWTMKWNKYGKFNFIHKDKMLITFQNQKSTVEKIKYGVNNEIGGFVVLDQQFDRYEKNYCSPEKSSDVFADVYSELTPFATSSLFYINHLLNNRLMKCNAQKTDCTVDLGLPDSLTEYYSLLSIIKPAINVYSRVNKFKEQSSVKHLAEVLYTNKKKAVQILRNDSYYKISKPKQTLAIHNYTVVEVMNFV